MSGATDLGRLRAAHASSWMAERGFVAELHRTVLERQRWLVETLAKAQKTATPPIGPFAVEPLADALEAAVAWDHRSAPLHASVCCALLAELVASAMCKNEEQAGGAVYPRIDAGRDSEWFAVHRPLSVFRNALFHPGAVKADDDATSGELGVHLERLRRVVESGAGTRDHGSDFKKLARDLARTPGSIASAAMAHWAVLRLDALGIFEASRIHLSAAGRRRGAQRHP